MISCQSLLPSHPQCRSDYKTIPLLTNQYKVSIPASCKVFLYTLSFSPPIPPDNNRLKKHLIRLLRPEISRYLEKFIHCGENLFSLKELSQEIQTAASGDDDSHNSEIAVNGENEDSLVLDCAYQNSFYNVKISSSGELDLSVSSLSKNSFLQFYNILLRDRLRNMHLVQLGSKRDHFDPSSARKIQGFPASVWPGYFTSINMLKGGLMLTIDCSFRLVRNDSVLNVIEENYKKFGTHCREHIRKQLIDSMVMTFYGSQQMYRIDDVLFEESPSDKFFLGSEEISYIKYFYDKYQAEIKIRNQPLLLARRSCKAEPIKLIPELCRMTGAGSLSDDNRLKREVSVHTRLKPEKRKHDIQDLANRLNTLPCRYWNMDIDNDPVQVTGKILPSPSIFTQGKKISINDKASFRITDTKLMNTVDLERWQIFCTDRDMHLSKDFVASLQQMANSYGIAVKNPIVKSVPMQKNMESSYVNCLKENVHPQAQLVVVLVPRNLPYLYKPIKQVLTTEKPVPSQVVLTSSIEKRDLSIYSKIVTQISCKIGGGPWAVSLPSAVPRNTMLVGIDVCHNTFNSRQSVLGFCASLTPTFTKYFSKIAFHEPNQEISSVLTPIFLESLKQYYITNNKTKPECIVIYRDGVGTSQYSSVVNHEIPQLIAAIREFDKTWKPEIVAIVVNKRVNQRFYFNSANPGAGVIVDNEVVWGHYNFYLMSHHVTAGSMTPTHYNVVVNDTNISTECLYELTYALCFMYYNWQGGIRVPAPCMYAHKIAYLVGKHTGMQVHQKLANTYFYL